MADWIGHMITAAPEWLFLPLLVAIVILCTVVWVLWNMAFTFNAWPFKSRRVYLGEKKHDKK